MGLIQWIIIIILAAIIIFGFASVIDFSKGIIKNVYPVPIITSKVTNVVDGDTLDLESGERVRFAVVNTPERGEYGYMAAKEWTEYRCLGKNAIIDLDSKQMKGSHERIIAAVYCDGVFINQELLELRLGVVLTSACAKSEFKYILCP